jgi:hypothetical protein
MPVSHRHQAVFIHIPRSAGTSINVALGICTEANKSDNAYRPKQLFGFDGKHFAQHLTAREVRDRVGRVTFDTYFRFAIVRDPYTRLVSAFYQGFARQGRDRTDIEGFRTFVRSRLSEQFHRPLDQDRHRHLKAQTTFVLDADGALMVDFIGRHENLAADMQAITDRLGLTLDLPRLNASHDFNYEAHFDEETRDAVRSLYRDDFERFSYQP